MNLTAKQVELSVKTRSSQTSINLYQRSLRRQGVTVRSNDRMSGRYMRCETILENIMLVIEVPMLTRLVEL